MTRRVLTSLLFLAVYTGLAAAALAADMRAPGSLSLWPASGLLIALLLHAPRRQWRAILALAALGSGIAGALSGMGAAMIGGAMIAQVAEGWIGALLLKREKRRESDLLREWLADSGAIAALGPALGTLCIAAAQWAGAGTVSIAELERYLIAHAVGNLVFFPLFALIVSGQFRDWLERGSMWNALELSGFVLVVMAATSWALVQPGFLPLLTPLLVAFLATCRFGMPAATLAVAALALSAWAGALGWLSPAWPAGSAAGSALAAAPYFLAFYLAVTVFCLQPLARHLTQNRRLAHALLQKDISSGEVELSLQAKDFVISEHDELYHLLADNMTDVVIKTDRAGNVLYASPSMERRAGMHPLEMIGRNILEMIHPSYGASFMSELDEVIDRQEDSAWIEYLGVGSDGEECWFDTQIRPLAGSRAKAEGAVIVLRNIAERKELEQQLFAATLTDPLTNLTNRRAFNSMLQYHLDVPIPGCLAIFDIDDFRSINREHGHAVGDKVLTTVAKLLRALLRKDDIISRIGGERFAVLLSQATPDQAELLCQRVVRTLAEASGSGPQITVSAGVSRIEGTLDDTLKRADAAVVVAKAKGRNRLEMEANAPRRWLAAEFSYRQE